jgi:hypothetical protein
MNIGGSSQVSKLALQNIQLKEKAGAILPPAFSLFDRLPYQWDFTIKQLK